MSLATQPPALFALATVSVGLMAWPAEYGWGYDGHTHGNKGVDGHNASKRFRDHHYTTFSCAPIGFASICLHPKPSQEVLGGQAREQLGAHRWRPAVQR